MQFVLLEGIHPNAVDLLQSSGLGAVVQDARALQGSELARALAGAHVLGLRSRTQLTADVLAQAPKLLAIGAFCIGTDQIDLQAAALHGIPVFNAPFSNTRSVAELVLAEVVLLLRGIPEKNAQLHRKVWSKSAKGAHEVRGKVLGIVGYGHIGTQVGVLAEQLGMEVVFHDIESRLPLGNARPLPTLDALLSQAHLVTLHVPDTPATRGLIASDQLTRMRPGAHLINASRGQVVDIEALCPALSAGHVGGAAIDVFPTEPASNGAPFESPLTAFDNVLLTPHIGGSTAEAQANIGHEVANKLVRFLDNGSTVSAVNFPHVSVPERQGMCRLLHVHRNVPGVLADINDRLRAHGINVAAQYLRTDAALGYVVIDVDSDAGTGLHAALCAVPQTIRCRVIE
jgi:D-3-phosphoglycerate dehydrogenase